MSAVSLSCRDEARRGAVRAKTGLNGLDYLEVSEDQLTLTVYFLGKAPADLDKANLRISGGLRITGITVLSIDIQREEDPERDDCMQVSVDRYGDFSSYSLSVVERDEQGRPTDRPLSGFDPRYARLDFSFKAACPGDLDCNTVSSCPTEPSQVPEINYLVKDYASFRRLMLDRIALLMPDWQERHVPDLGVTLVELLAYTADRLSYYQDAVATEAYLDTARQRISVRRHARLVDYRLHEGCNARTWICLNVAQDISLSAEDFYFITAPDDGDATTPLKHEELASASPGSYLIYEALLERREQPIECREAHNRIRIYTWGDKQCCLPKGATSATLVDPGTTAHKLKLKACDILVFEEVKGRKTGNPADADPAHRHAVRLTQVQNTVDSLTGQRIVEVEWGREDALPFAVCVSAVKPDDCTLIEDVSVVSGNVLLADHGERVSETLEPVPGTTRLPACDEHCGVREAIRSTAWYRPTLSRPELTFSQALPACAKAGQCGASARLTPASALLSQDVHLALPQLTLHEGEGTPVWHVQADLLGSRHDERHFVAEINDRQQAQLRFGNNELGLAPKPGTRFEARYRVGNGPVGNVGPEAIKRIVFRNNMPHGVAIQPRNPFPAQGGTEPESLAEAKLTAPDAFRRILQRAITADDYAHIVMRDFADSVQKARATLRWTGSDYEMLVAVDPYADANAGQTLLCEIDRHLRRYRRIGHAVKVVFARTVALQLEMQICVKPAYFKAHVKAALLDTFSNRRLGNGRLGFFHPDRLSFGDGVYLSKLIAEAQAVEGVESVAFSLFKRLFEAPANEIADGLLPLAPMEIARLDNDANFPENGKLVFDMEGGR